MSITQSRLEELWEQLLADDIKLLFQVEIGTILERVHLVMSMNHWKTDEDTVKWVLENWEKEKFAEKYYQDYLQYHQTYLQHITPKAISFTHFKIGNFSTSGISYYRFKYIKKHKIIPWSQLFDREWNIYKVAHMSNYLLMTLDLVERISGNPPHKLLNMPPFQFTLESKGA